MTKESPNKDNPSADIEFIVQELFDLFMCAEGDKIELVSALGSTFHARVLNAAKHLGVS